MTDATPWSFALPPDRTWPGPPPYLFTEPVETTLRVALAAERPLLVSGPPGSGKSTLAGAMAGVLGWRYLWHTLTSRSRVDELTAEVDHLRRLHDAQAAARDAPPMDRECYVEPGVLWWAFNPATARRRGAGAARASEWKADPRYQPPKRPPVRGGGTHAVVLLDEIDKAEPELPNDLLEPLDRRAFHTPGGGRVTRPAAQHLLVVITTNRERELPPAFLRRCVVLTLGHPTPKQLCRIGARHVPEASAELLVGLANLMPGLREQAGDLSLREPSTSEYLDALRACLRFDCTPGDGHLWPLIERATLLKDTGEQDSAGAGEPATPADLDAVGGG